MMNCLQKREQSIKLLTNFVLFCLVLGVVAVVISPVICFHLYTPCCAHKILLYLIFLWSHETKEKFLYRMFHLLEMMN